MTIDERTVREHEFLTRRFFLRCAAGGLVGMSGVEMAGGEDGVTGDWEYLTKSGDFRNVERHKPYPYQLPLERRRELGMERETWKLEVVADPGSNSRLRRPMTVEAGTALDFAGLMKLAETRAVRFLKVMTCNNIPDPLGMGLWEGVPLRDVIWMAQPDKNVRRLYYHGYYDGDPKHLFQSSLSIGRVLEDPPGEPPVILCTKLNGEWLTGERGGPVRMIVPGAYGFKSIKWLTRVVLTNDHQANDTYAGQNNDIDSAMKTFARFRQWPEKAKAGERLEISGVAQCGMSGLGKVQYWIKPAGEADPTGDRYFATADWKDAVVLRPPDTWGKRKVEMNGVEGFGKDGKPGEWPLRDTVAHWAVVAPGLAAGEYVLRCRTIDARGVAQPMPRPFQKSGGNAIQRVDLVVV